MTAPYTPLISEFSRSIRARRTAEQPPTGSQTVLMFRFPSPGPWEQALTDQARPLAADIAAEPGLRWKIWLEDRKSGHAGGIYLFDDAAAAERYRAKHIQRLAAMGLTRVEAHAFQVNAALSALTLAGAALDEAGASQPGATSAAAT
ncbi:MAG TPA: monooxygenase [Caulobacteraceae bacterium]|nr:monooxygenase [Caulobacteraceae bacterium]